MKNLNAAPGPYEVVTIIDEEGKARGRNGEKWLLIRNADGAIASVYPGQDAEGTARLLAASWNMRDRLGVARAFIEDQLAVLERSYLPEPNEAEKEELAETQYLLDTIRYVIAEAEGNQLSSVPTPPSAPDSGEANTKNVFPDKPLEDTLL